MAGTHQFVAGRARGRVFKTGSFNHSDTCPGVAAQGFRAASRSNVGASALPRKSRIVARCRAVSRLAAASFATSSLFACHDVTAPLDTACTLVAHIPAVVAYPADPAYPPFVVYPAVDVSACYRICPEAAQQWAATHNQEFKRGYRC